MIESWFERLKEAINNDGRSLRAISMAAGLSPNYLTQALADGKEPGINKLMAILDSLGAASRSYVLIGQKTTPEDEEFLRLLLALSPEVRANALDFFRSLQAHADEKAQST